MFAKWLIKRLEKQEETREEGRERLIFISGLIDSFNNVFSLKELEDVIKSRATLGDGHFIDDFDCLPCL